MNFREMLDDDIKNVFLNVEEFGSEHFVEGKKITCIFDDEALRERQSGNELGVSESSMLLYACVNDLPSQKGAGEHLLVDGKEYVIDDWAVNMGMATIALSQTRTA